MEQKPSPNKLTDEELLQLSLQNSSKQVFEDDVLFFISSFNLELGRNKVSLDFLYSIYCKWSKKKVNKDTFTLKLKEIFPSELIERKVFLLMDASVASITKSMLDLSHTNISTPRKVGIQSILEQFKKEFDLQPSKSWVGEVELYKLYRDWCAKAKKGFIKKEDLLDGLSVLFINRFNNKNLKEFALTYKLKEEVEKETSTK